ncbi:hypothetical protein FGO68_gene7668 [Halteria grandinella]|uniref:Uncharacterized protein n=1 Tax=Halteria grandinella TaxID=5974 RepID=A0A8J8T022_HALGN|nr:hypothetical protein FGO68_gene7668 [Halteria grandinella]
MRHLIQGKECRLTNQSKSQHRAKLLVMHCYLSNCILECRMDYSQFAVDQQFYCYRVVPTLSSNTITTGMQKMRWKICKGKIWEG